MKTGTIKKSTLAQRALLVSVNIRQWSGKKIDKKATDTANTAHKADATAGAYHKKLLPAARELELIGTIATQVRQVYYEHTLPWMNDGTRIISGKTYAKFQKAIREMKVEFDNAVKAFEAVYPELQKQSAAKLGGLYNSAEYPPNIGEYFSFDVSFLPMPEAKDFRTAMSDQDKRVFEKKMKEVEAAAMRDASQRLLDVIKGATEKLKDPKGIFRDSLLENIAEVANMIPMLNISGDDTLDKISKDAKKLVDSIDTKAIRDKTDPTEREKATKALAAIESKMGAFMGRIK